MSEPFEDALIELLTLLSQEPPANWSKAAERRDQFKILAGRLREIRLGRRMENDLSPYDLSGRRIG